MGSRHFRSFVAGCAVASVSLSAVAVTVANAATAPRTALVTAAVRVPVGDRSLGAVAPSTPIHFEIYLNSRNVAALNAFTAGVTNRHSLTYGHYLAPGEFARRFGAAPSAVAAVRSSLRSQGLSVSGVARDGLALQVTGSAVTVNAALHTTLQSYRLVGGGRGMAATSGVRLPAAIAHDVLGVVGLNNLVHPTSSAVRLSHIKWPNKSLPGRFFAQHGNGIPGAPAVCPAAASATHQGFGGITDNQVASAYGVTPLYGAGDLGAGQTIAVYELEPFALSDVAAFDQCYFGTNNTSHITTINVDGGPGAGSGSGESALDIQNISALAPQAHILVYQAANTTAGALDAYGQIVANDAAKVVSTSWGLCESALLSFSPGTADVEHLLFEQAAAQGQTVFAAAGDAGADDCAGHFSQPASPYQSVDDPASQPYVVSVGGTTAVSVSNPPVEQVWNDGAQGGAGGGGPSMLWPMPAWQRNVPAVASAAPSSVCGTGTSPCRVTPDISAFADQFTGLTINFGGSWTTIGGTSSSAPIWAALLAEVNASSSCTSQTVTAHGVGFVSPLLYEVGANPTLASQSYNDVTAGNNDIFSMLHGAYSAKVGFDAASGFGSPNLVGSSSPGLAAALCGAAQEATTSQVTSLTPTSGPTSGGTSVQITGTGFMTGSTVNVAGVTFGNFPAASFTVTSPTTLTAVTAPEGVPSKFGKTIPAGTESLTEITYTSGHVATGPTFSYLAQTNGVGLPTVLSVGPSGGPVTGGNTVTVYGTGFTGATAVTIGSRPVTSFTVKSDSQISVVVPPQGSASCLSVSHTTTSGLCQSQVVVTTASGHSKNVPVLKPLQGFLPFNNNGVPYAPSSCHCEIYPSLTEYDFQKAPTIKTIVSLFASPSAPLANPLGGDEFKITGSGFNYLTLNNVAFGDPTLQANQDVSFISVTYNTILVQSQLDTGVSPHGNVLPLRVESQGGGSKPFNMSFGAVPQVTSLSDMVLPSAGGTSLVLHGAGFTGTTEVEFISIFGAPSTLILKNFTVNSDTSITVQSPSLVPGSYLVAVIGYYSNSTIFNTPPPGIPASYAFENIPAANDAVTVIYPGGAALTGSSNTTCSAAGGCAMTLTGINLGPQANLTVYVGTQAGTITNDVTVGNVSTLTVTMPSSFLGTTGTFSIFVDTGNGTTPTTLDAFATYN